MKITNNSNIPLGLAVWLLHDEYDYNADPRYLSVTTLMKPLKQIILAKRVPKESRTMDVSELVAARMGTALHDSIERSWTQGHDRALRLLGYPESIRKLVLINPTKEQLAATEGAIPVYLENRAFKEVGDWTVGGKYDLVAEGIPQDNKSTSAYTWLYGTRDDEHILQLSLYKWLNPEIITEDYGQINYIFTDWAKAQAAANPKYPQSRLECKQLDLKSPAEMQKWVEAKLALISKFWDAPESAMPNCTDEELWRSEPKYKYYSNPEAAQKGGRSTKNFDSLAEAHSFKASKGVGVVITIVGEPKRCGYCAAFDVCKQKDSFTFAEPKE